MEGEMDGSYLEAKKRVIKAVLEEIRDSVERINNYTSFNVLPHFTPAQVECLLNHIDACHKVLFELAQVNDYELPYRVPKLIYAAQELRKAVS